MVKQRFSLAVRAAATLASPLILLLAFAAFGDSPLRPVYARKGSFSAVVMSRDDLLDLMERTRKIIISANQVSKSDPVIPGSDPLIRFEVGDGLTALTINTFPDQSVRFPTKVSYYANLLYFARSTPISRVRVDLRDFSREIEVEGIDAEQVESLFAFLSQELDRHTTWLSGTLFRFFLGFVAFISISLLTVLRGVGWGSTIVLWAVACIVAFWFMLFAGSWLPGAAFYTGDPSFVVRNAAWISFFGVLLAPLLTALGIAFPYYVSKRKT